MVNRSLVENEVLTAKQCDSIEASPPPQWRLQQPGQLSELQEDESLVTIDWILSED